MAESRAMTGSPDPFEASSSDVLPSDPAELRAFAAALLERCARLERLLKLANDTRYGRSSEKLAPDQLQLVLEDIDQAVAALEAMEDRAEPCNPRETSRRAPRQSRQIA